MAEVEPTKIGMFDDVRDALGVDQDRGARMEFFAVRTSFSVTAAWT